MKFSADNLLKQLDQPEIIDWALELKHREAAYACLTRAITGNELNKNQSLNALHALFQIGYQEHTGEILKIFVETVKHSDQGIRSEAVQLAIGLVRFASKWHKSPLILNDAQRMALRDAIARGLTPKASELAHEYFG